MSKTITIEGYVYKYLHDGDYHIVIMPRKLSKREIEELAKKVSEQLIHPSCRQDAIKKIVSDFERHNIIHSIIFWRELDREACLLCYAMDKYIGKKVRIKIEVVE